MKFQYKGVTLEVPDGVYYPAEDSMLMAEQLEQMPLRGKRLLELGCGCGLLAVLAAKQGAAVTAADISEGAVAATKSNAEANGVSLRAVVSDLLENIDGFYDAIIFNPPYLPPSEEDAHAPLHAKQWSGGMPLIRKFLAGAKKHLAPRGRVYFAASSLTGDVVAAARAEGYAARITARQKVAWEELVVVEARAL